MVAIKELKTNVETAADNVDEVVEKVDGRVEKGGDHDTDRKGEGCGGKK